MTKTFKVKTAAWQNTPCPENLTHLYLEVLSNTNKQPTITGTTHFYKYPLRAGAYSLTFEKAPENSFWQRGLYDALGDISTEPTQTAEPLTRADKELINQICGAGDIKSIRRTLTREYPAEDLNGYSWQDIINALKQAPQTAAQATNGGKGDPKHSRSDKEPITLKAFMELHCDCKGYDIMSKPAAMYQHERKGNITLNDLIPHENGKARIFSVNYLYDNWADYRKQMPSLPPLKD